MNVYWNGQVDRRPQYGEKQDHRSRFDLSFGRHGERTIIERQYVSYPFHLTRPFSLDPDIPALTTVYQQSSSGGVYRSDRLTSQIRMRAGTAAHITTQAATIVHDCYGCEASQCTQIDMEEDAFLGLVPEALVFFPGAEYATSLDITLHPTSALMVGESFTEHDFANNLRTFGRFCSETVVRDTSGRLLVRECFQIGGQDFAAATTPIGPFTIVANFLMLGKRARLPTTDAIATKVLRRMDCVAGVSELPNNAGLSIKILASSAAAVRAVTDDLFSIAVQSALGKVPHKRRK
ncbi:Urease accessory protein UreD [Hyphomicrobium denitrificans ATCC 51888]|uniref:Urease accessory protein UreD n=1 Tax=Hyphomicrobium denitrificans (strain ATCC 51888 / DSM 1869 / NCIMB 11706 / TK 0415) TaxID=582899 RepID=D8JUH3_HYPDA|nr:urease accessory protein UreD [Hyphomicrobium denitrificans]ADJ24603.1 Urease accessory protein UreD [Hyphomicrobium denitrificans ATCC 51888]